MAREAANASGGGCMPRGAPLRVFVFEDGYVQNDHTVELTERVTEALLPCHSKTRRAIERQAIAPMATVDPSGRTGKRRNAGRVRKALLIDRVTNNDTPVRYFLVDPRMELPGRTLAVSAPAILWRDAFACDPSISAQMDAAAALGAVETTEPKKNVTAGLMAVGADMPPALGTPKDMQVQCFRDLKAALVGCYTRLVFVDPKDDATAAAGEFVGAPVAANDEHATSLGYGRKTNRKSVHIRHDIRVRVAAAIAMARWQTARAPALRSIESQPSIWRRSGAPGYEQSPTEVPEQTPEDLEAEAAMAEAEAAHLQEADKAALGGSAASQAASRKRVRFGKRGGAGDDDDDEDYDGEGKKGGNSRWKRSHSDHLVVLKKMEAQEAKQRAKQMRRAEAGAAVGGAGDGDDSGEDSDGSAPALRTGAAGNTDEHFDRTSVVNGRTLVGGGDAGEVTSAVGIRPGVFARRVWPWMGLHTLLFVYRQRFVRPGTDLPMPLAAHRAGPASRHAADMAMAAAAAAVVAAAADGSSADHDPLGSLLDPTMGAPARIVGRFSRYVMQQGLVVAIGRVRHSDGFTPSLVTNFLLRLAHGHTAARAAAATQSGSRAPGVAGVRAAQAELLAAGSGPSSADAGAMSVASGGLDGSPFMCVLLRALVGAVIDASEVREAAEAQSRRERRQRRKDRSDAVRKAQAAAKAGSSSSSSSSSSSFASAAAGLAQQGKPASAAAFASRDSAGAASASTAQPGASGRGRAGGLAAKLARFLHGLLSSELLSLHMRDEDVSPGAWFGMPTRGTVAAAALRGLTELDVRGLGGTPVAYTSLLTGAGLPLRVRVAALEGALRVHLGARPVPPRSAVMSMIGSINVGQALTDRTMALLRHWACRVALPWFRWSRWLLRGVANDPCPRFRTAALATLRRVHAETAEVVGQARAAARRRAVAQARLASRGPGANAGPIGGAILDLAGVGRASALAVPGLPGAKAAQPGWWEDSDDEGGRGSALARAGAAASQSSTDRASAPPASSSATASSAAPQGGSSSAMTGFTAWWTSATGAQIDTDLVLRSWPGVDNFRPHTCPLMVDDIWMPWRGVWQGAASKDGLLSPLASPAAAAVLEVVARAGQPKPPAASMTAALLAGCRADANAAGAAKKALGAAADATGVLFGLVGAAGAADFSARRAAFHLAQAVFGRAAVPATLALRRLEQHEEAVLKARSAAAGATAAAPSPFSANLAQLAAAQEGDGSASVPAATAAVARVMRRIVSRRRANLSERLAASYETEVGVHAAAESFPRARSEAEAIATKHSIVLGQAPVVQPTKRSRKPTSAKLAAMAAGADSDSAESLGSEADGESDSDDGDWGKAHSRKKGSQGKAGRSKSSGANGTPGSSSSSSGMQTGSRGALPIVDSVPQHSSSNGRHSGSKRSSDSAVAPLRREHLLPVVPSAPSSSIGGAAGMGVFGGPSFSSLHSTGAPPIPMGPAASSGSLSHSASLLGLGSAPITAASTSMGLAASMPPPPPGLGAIPTIPDLPDAPEVPDFSALAPPPATMPPPSGL